MVFSQLINQLKTLYPNLKRSQIKFILKTIFNEITYSLVKKQKPVEIRKFGRFFIKHIKANTSARNPKTGERIYVPEKKKISFKASKFLKEEINNS